MLVAGKVWGQTSEIYANPMFELHRLEILGGRECSLHRHVSKWSGLWVESGEILVYVWQLTGLVDKTVLGPGAQARIQPGVFHKFVGGAPNSVVYEFYWAQLESNDIERDTTGK